LTARFFASGPSVRIQASSLALVLLLKASVALSFRAAALVTAILAESEEIQTSSK
jgi:hypothetical protein